MVEINKISKQNILSRIMFLPARSRVFGILIFLHNFVDYFLKKIVVSCSNHYQDRNHILII